MDFLRTHGFTAFSVGQPIHTGSEGLAKGPHLPDHSRDFAGLRAQTPSIARIWFFARNFNQIDQGFSD
jgi:hypothetical protein